MIRTLKEIDEIENEMILRINLARSSSDQVIEGTIKDIVDKSKSQFYNVIDLLTTTEEFLLGKATETDLRIAYNIFKSKQWE